MLELYQFELSQYSEKVRLILDYKELDYKKIEVTPGVGQIDLFRLSGQSKVPVLKDGETIITDSTDIAFYLDRKFPEKPIIPTDPLLRGQCLLMEEWADESIGLKGRKALIGALNQNPNFRTSVLPSNTPDFLKTLVGAVPSEILDFFSSGVGFGGNEVKDAIQGLKQDLEALSLILQHRPYLVTDEPTLADLAVAGLSMTLKFPAGDYLSIPSELKGKGIPGLADNSTYEPFFAWRDRLYSTYRKSSFSASTGTGNPTVINIE
jgi:glutathione S-transferase